MILIEGGAILGACLSLRQEIALRWLKYYGTHDEQHPGFAAW